MKPILWRREKTKPRSKKPKKVYDIQPDKWVEEMLEPHLLEIKNDLTSFKPYRYIVRKIFDWGYWEGIGLNSAHKRLERYYKRVLRAEAEAMGKYLPRKRIQDKINVIDELSALISRQKKRIKKLRQREKKTPLLLEQLTRETSHLQSMLQTLAKLQFETGALQKASVSRKGTISTDPDDPSKMTFESVTRINSALDELESEFNDEDD